MYVVEVALFKKGLRDELSFWSANELTPGVIVSVPVRNKYVTAVVLKCEALANQKTDIKTAPFKLKKITKVISKIGYNTDVINELVNFSNEYAVTVSDILADTIDEQAIQTILGYEPETLSNKSITYIHEPKSKRLLLYKRFIREALSNKKVIVITVPTKTQGLAVFNAISHGIEKKIILGLEGGKAFNKLVKQVCSSGKSICVIANAKNTCGLLPFVDVLIVDECASRFYTNNKRPYIPYNQLLIRMANVTKLKVIIAGSHLNIDQYLLIKNKIISANNESNTRFLIDSQKINFSVRDKNNWELFTPEAKNILNKAIDERVFVFSSKQGLFPITICSDCKTTFNCNVCKAPMRLVEKSSGNNRQFVCPRCKNKTSAETTCPVCNSWNLKPFGIGSERIVEAIKNMHPETPLFYLDEEASEAKIKKVLKEWATKNGFLIGSERIMNKMAEPAVNIIIASIDSLFGIPNYRITEKILEIILRANDCAIKNVHIVTNLKNEYLFNEIKRGNLKLFYEDELADRETPNFPPLGYLLTIRKNIKESEIIKTKKLLREIDPHIEIQVFVKSKGSMFMTATGLYKPDLWHTKIAPILGKITDQTFNIYVNETDWLK